MISGLSAIRSLPHPSSQEPTLYKNSLEPCRTSISGAVCSTWLARSAIHWPPCAVSAQSSSCFGSSKRLVLGRTRPNSSPGRVVFRPKGPAPRSTAVSFPALPPIHFRFRCPQRLRGIYPGLSWSMSAMCPSSWAAFCSSWTVGGCRPLMPSIRRRWASRRLLRSFSQGFPALRHGPDVSRRAGPFPKRLRL